MADNPTWKFVLTDVAGDEIGELDKAGDIHLTYSVNKPVTLNFRLSQRDAMALFVQEGQTRVKGYRDGILRVYNTVWNCTDNFDAEGGSLEVTTVSPLWLLTRRVLQAQREFVDTQPADAALSLLQAEDTRYPIAIDLTATDTPTIGTRTFNFERNKSLYECLEELFTAFDGFEIELVPVDEAGHMAQLQMYEGVGTDNVNVFFEYGLGKENVLSVTREVDLEDLTTDMHVLGKLDGAVASHSPPAEYEPLRELYGNVYDSVQAHNDIAHEEFLDAIRETLMLYRQAPKESYSFQPADTAGFRPWDDFGLGDFVTFRMREGRIDIDGSVRIYGYDIAVTDEGAERITALRTVRE